MWIEQRQCLVSRHQQGCPKGLAAVLGVEAPALEVERAIHPALGNGLLQLRDQRIAPGLLIEQQPLPRCGQRLTPRLVLLNDCRGAMQFLREVFHGITVAGNPEQALLQQGILSRPPDPGALHPFIQRQTTQIQGEAGVIAGINQLRVVGIAAIRVAHFPGERPPLQLGTFHAGGIAHQLLEALVQLLAQLLPAEGEVVALALPLLPSGGLDLVAQFLRVAQQIAPAQLLQGLAHGRLLIAALHPVRQTFGHQLVCGRLAVLNQLQQSHRLGSPQHQLTALAAALGLDPGHRGLGVSIESGVLHLVDPIQAHQGADRLIR